VAPSQDALPGRGDLGPRTKEGALLGHESRLLWIIILVGAHPGSVVIARPQEYARPRIVSVRASSRVGCSWAAITLNSAAPLTHPHTDRPAKKADSLTVRC